MKTKITILLVLFMSMMTIAQNGINYKAVVKDASGNVIANSTIDVQFTILKDGGGDSVYTEEHAPMTDDNGIIVVCIGEGTQMGNAQFSNIIWYDDDYFLNVKIDTGNGYQDMGTTEFKYVPYAKVADRSQTNATVVFPKYLDLNYSDFSLVSGGKLRVIIEFNIQMNPSSFVAGSSFLISGAGGSGTGTFQWTNGNTRLVFTSNENFTTLSPCFSGGLTLTIKGSGATKALDVQGKPIDGNKNGMPGGDFTVTFDIVC